MNLDDLEAYLKKQTGYKHVEFYSRASHGLYLHLRALEELGYKKKIAIPAFLCHAPAAAIQKANWEIHLYNINNEFQPIDQELEELFRSGIDVFLIAHLFGIYANSSFLRKNKEKIFTIEDACQYNGGNIMRSTPLGQSVLYSFGTGKTGSLGHGGAIVFKDKDIHTNSKNINHPNANSEAVFRDKYYSKLESFISGQENSMIGLLETYQSFIESDFNQNMMKEWSKAKLEKDITERKRKYQLYETILSNLGLKIINSNRVDIPWRFIFLIENISFTKQYLISQSLREKGVDISNWYISLDYFLKKINSFNPEPSNNLSKSIFQLWIDESTDDDKIHKNCDAIKEILKEL